MDKLEKALQKARQQRQANAGTGWRDIPSTPLKNNVHKLPTAVDSVRVNEEYLQSYPIIAHRKRSKEADIFRLLRTQVLQIMRESGFRTLGITSPNYGDGKTTVALNLAISIAQDVKQTVLLADLDLRKPNITEYLGVRAPHGLSDYYLRNTPVSDCLIRLSFERLVVFPAGRPIENSSEALGSPKIAALAEELKNRYADRLVIYDMPPILEQDDPLAFMPHVDAVLMVVRDGITPVDDIKKSMNLLVKAHVIGTVLNYSGN